MDQSFHMQRRQERTRRRARKDAQRQLWLRGLLLLGIVAIPTIAAQGALPGLAKAMGLSREPGPVMPMPFEIAGQSFPGSAFYYLDEPPSLQIDVAELRQDDTPLETEKFTEEFGAGAAAKAFQSAGSGLDKARALRCLSMAVYYEAASESQSGQEAVAQVVLNRVAHPAYPASICGVVFQGSERKTGCQFTFTCDGSLRRQPSAGAWARAQSVALAALSGYVFKPVGWATHYHTHAVNPYWASSLDYIGSVGAHRFYRWKGNAGQAGAFTNAYRGGEPVAAPAPRAFDDEGTPAPLAVAPPPNSAIGTSGGTSGEPKVGIGRAASATMQPPVSQPQTPPAKAGPPQSGDVKDEYANSGRWIRQPNQTN